MKVAEVEIDDVLRADAVQQLGLLGAAHDVHQADTVLLADLVQHLAEVRRGRRMHQCLVALALHRLGHAEGDLAASGHARPRT